jgi:hypothetical protein
MKPLCAFVSAITYTISYATSVIFTNAKIKGIVKKQVIDGALFIFE